ncbi:MAG: hypothetical protein EP346_14330 [Bacteroidetes bacterium]|nr:MAG: hypothetical protein EP346_14330 [Bacteroidota bacterium]
MSKTFRRMGEFARDEIKRRGLKLSQIASNMGIARQTLDYRFRKDEWSLSEMETLQDAVGDKSFFDGYFQASWSEQYRTKKRSEQVGQVEIKGGKKKKSELKPGYRISVEVDPENFNPKEWDRMSNALKEMMDKLKK